MVAPVVVGMTIDAGEAAVDRARGYALIRSFAARALAVSLFFFRGVTARRGGADAFAEQDTRAG